MLPDTTRKRPLFWAIAAPRMYGDTHVYGVACVGDYAVVSGDADLWPVSKPQSTERMSVAAC